jgi:hypothetical protein
MLDRLEEQEARWLAVATQMGMGLGMGTETVIGLAGVWRGLCAVRASGNE